MDTFNFLASLSADVAPEDISIYLLALWYDAKGDWNKAHQAIQDVATSHASWIHAYLHRKEGDKFNADYWYNKAGRKSPSASLHQEWEQLVEEFANSK